MVLQEGDRWKRALEGIDAVLAVHDGVRTSESPNTKQDEPSGQHQATGEKQPTMEDGLTGKVILAIQGLVSEAIFTNHDILKAIGDAAVETTMVARILRRLAEKGIIELKEAGAGRRPAAYVKCVPSSKAQTV